MTEPVYHAWRTRCCKLGRLYAQKKSTDTRHNLYCYTVQPILKKELSPFTRLLMIMDPVTGLIHIPELHEIVAHANRSFA